MLGPVLFSGCIDELDTGVESTLRKFAGHAELGGAISSLEGREALQGDLARLERRAIARRVKFNRSKGWILHLGWCNAGYTQRLHGEVAGVQPCRKRSGREGWWMVSLGGVRSGPWQPEGPTASWGNLSRVEKK